MPSYPNNSARKRVQERLEVNLVVRKYNYWYISCIYRVAEPLGAAYLKVGEVRGEVDSDLAGWGRGGLSWRGSTI